MLDYEDLVDLPRERFSLGAPTLHFAHAVKACCLKCGYESAVKDFTFVCMFCGSSNFNLHELDARSAGA